MSELGRTNESITPHTLTAGFAEQPLKGEDSWVVEPEKGIFAVFDGVGGHSGGASASQLAADLLRSGMPQKWDGYTSKDVEAAVKHHLIATSEAIMNGSRGGMTTAIVALVYETDGQRFVTWAAVGDSRLYVYDTGLQRAEQISRDEGEGRRISNALGYKKDIRQIGTFIMPETSQLMLCSDGVTGDTPEQLLSDDEIAASMAASSDPQEQAEALLRIARKRDDRTCIVVHCS